MFDEAWADEVLYRLKDGRASDPGIYTCAKCLLAWQSDRLESNPLTFREVVAVCSGGDPVASKAYEETAGHLAMFDLAMSGLDADLSEDLILAMHGAFAGPVFEYRANGYPVGAYKTRPNTVGGLSTVGPEHVPGAMGTLMAGYRKEGVRVLADVCRFHAEFERIHPFQDGNGRVGRMILFRECVRAGIPPVVVRACRRERYAEGLRLSRAAGDDRILMDVMSDGQVWFLDALRREMRYGRRSS